MIARYVQKGESIDYRPSAAVYWDAANHKATTVAAGNPYLGKAVAAAESADELARVLLNAPFVATAAAE